MFITCRHYTTLFFSRHKISILHERYLVSPPLNAKRIFVPKNDDDKVLYITLVVLFDFVVQGGDLFDAIAEANKYSEREASRMMRDLSSALDYLHSISICHRDIKPENLLVSYCETSSSSSSKHQTALDFDNNGQPHHHRSIKSLKLADFGLAVELKVGNKLYDVCGTPNYVAPEILSESGYDHKVDIWAAGVIAYVLLCGFPPFVSPENDQEELFDQILTGTFEFSSPAFDDVSLEAKQLIVQMLQVDSDQRISARQVLDHSWVSVSWLLDKFPETSLQNLITDFSSFLNKTCLFISLLLLFLPWIHSLSFPSLILLTTWEKTKKRTRVDTNSVLCLEIDEWQTLFSASLTLSPLFLWAKKVSHENACLTRFEWQSLL